MLLSVPFDAMSLRGDTYAVSLAALGANGQKDDSISGARTRAARAVYSVDTRCYITVKNYLFQERSPETGVKSEQFWKQLKVILRSISK